MRQGSIETDVLVVGAGVAGCASAIALRRKGLQVAIAEKAVGRPHRFCGEFVSGEALGFLATLDAAGEVEKLRPNRVQRMGLYPTSGRPFTMDLAEPGFGLSRQKLDAALLDCVIRCGATYLEGTSIEKITGAPASGYFLETRDRHGASGPGVHARAVVGAQGKRSPFDRLLGRNFVQRGSPFVGVKRHYRGADRGRDVELYLFPGGYCGFVGIEDGQINLCMLATQDALESCGGKPEGLIDAACQSSHYLQKWFRQAEPVPGTLMAISQIPFAAKEQVVNGVFMVGDSAGLPAPFLGLGVATALCSAIQCSRAVAGWLNGGESFETARVGYQTWWRARFANTQKWGHRASRLLCHSRAAHLASQLLSSFPSIGDKIYRRSRAASGATSELARAER